MKSSIPIYFSIVFICFFACKKPPKTQVIKEDAHRKALFLKEYKHAASFYPSQKDSAFHYFTAIAINTKDSSLASAAYTYMGMIQYDLGDYFGSQESYLQSLDFLDKQDEQQNERFISSYNGLGLDGKELKNYDNAIDYFSRALTLSKDDEKRLILLNNIGTAYSNKKYYNTAVDILDSILQNSKQNPVLYARILSNLAYAKWQRNNNYQAAPELLSALQIRLREQDKEGLNASYGHLADYYMSLKSDSALSYTHKMYENAKALNSPDDQLWALQKMILLSSGKEIKHYFHLYKQLDDSLQTSRNQAKNQFALIRYETEKQKADNLILQKENAETKLRVIWLQVVSLIIGIGAITGFILYRKRKQQAMRKQELRTSQKVHDVVANGLYTIINKIEHEEKLEKEQLLDEMEVLYEQSRNISYDRSETKQHYSEEPIPGLLKSFSTQETRVSIVGYSPALWSCLSNKAQSEIRYALQNLMINMKKHSQAKNVVVRFEQTDNHLKIQYTDDGIGVPANFHYGNGLTGTETRIKHIGGRLIFDASTPQGVKIQILIPIEQAQ